MDRRERLGDLETSLLAAFQGWQAKMWTALPGIINSFDPAAMTCTVQPALKAQQLLSSGETVLVTMPLLVDCPVVFPGGGGFSLTFPVVPGDECLVVFASRCIDAWWQAGGVQPQAEFRMHDLSDGFAFVGTRSVPHVPVSISTDAVQLRSDSGSSYIGIAHSGDITVHTPNTVAAAAANVTISATSVAISATSVSIEAAVSITGTLTVSETVSASAVVASTSLGVGGLDVGSHVHHFTDNVLGGAADDVTVGPSAS